MRYVEQPVPTNGALADELARNRGQRDDCAARMDGVRQWRSRRDPAGC
jgi:hypothetical protein